MTAPTIAPVSTQTDARLPMTILGGFLGSGKTTLLEGQYREPGTAIIVNDAGDRSPDLSADVHALLGGCACCDRRSDLVDLLRTVCGSRHGGGQGPARVVLETSGLADPARILAAVEADPVLVSNVRIADVTVTLDAVRGVSDLLHEPLARAQVEQADTVVVTKADLVTEDELGVVLATVKAVNPAAQLQVTELGRIRELPVFDPASAIGLPELDEDAKPEPPQSCWIPVPGLVDWTVLALWLGALVHAHPHEVLRVKGMLATARGSMILHAARGTIGLPALVGPESLGDKELGLVFVTRGIDPAALRASWDAHRAALSTIL